MARIRSVKPELRTDLTVAAWPIPVRYAWVLLWGYLDDHGRGRDDMRLVVADLFPLDRSVTEKKVNDWLTTMSTVKAEDDTEPPLCRYEVAGQHYLHAVNWEKHQRVSHARDSSLPPCPIHDGLTNDSGKPPEYDRNDSGKPPEVLRPHARGGEQGAGSRGAEEQGVLTAQTVIASWIDRQKQRPPQRVVGQAASEVSSLLAESFSPDVIGAALDEMSAKRTHPATLPSLVHGLVNGGGSAPRTSRNQQVLQDSFARAQQAEATGQPFGELT